jgi:hypothetical protein
MLVVGVNCDLAPDWRVDEFDRRCRLTFACGLFRMWGISRYGESNDHVGR